MVFSPFLLCWIELLVGYFVFHYMWQLQQKDVIQTLPKPLSVSMVASYVSNKEEEDKVEDEHEEVGLWFNGQEAKA